MSMTHKRWFALGVIGLTFILWLDISTPSIALTLQEPTIAQTTRLTPAITVNRISADRIIQLVNDDRKYVGLSEVHADLTLTKVAQSKAERYAAADHFGHIDLDGGYVWKRLLKAGYSYSLAGENIARMGLERDSDYVVLQWEISPTHFANFVQPEFRDIGIGIAEGMHDGKRMTWIIQLFGVRN